MTDNKTHRIVSHETKDGTRTIAVVHRTPETDQLTDDEIITQLEEWKAKRQRVDAPRDRWPMPASFNDWLNTTKPGPKEPCPQCGCWSLRLAAMPDNPADETVVCTMLECEACSFYRA